MTLFGAIVSFFGQLMVGAFLLYIVYPKAFAMQQTRYLTHFQIACSEWFFSLLHLQCLVIMVLMAWWAFQSADVSRYYWHALSVVSSILYLMYLWYLKINTQSREHGQRWQDIYQVLTELESTLVTLSALPSSLDSKRNFSVHHTRFFSFEDARNSMQDKTLEGLKLIQHILDLEPPASIQAIMPAYERQLQTFYKSLKQKTISMKF